MADATGNFERTMSLGDRALAHIRAHRTSAKPRAYEFWFAYVSGAQPALTRSVNDILTRTGSITQAEIDELYERFLNASRSLSSTEKATTHLITEMGQIDRALLSAHESLTGYCKTLMRASVDLERPGGAGIETLVADLLRQTNDTERVNRRLADRLAEAMAEMATLRDRLEALRTESQCDPVTGVLSRRTFDISLADFLVRARKTGKPFSLAMIDIDHFKAVNDSFGHLTGDQVLRLVATTIRQHVKGHDVVARFGGEEFALLLPETNLPEAYAVAEKVRLAVMSRELVKRSTGENLGKITVSIGVSLWSREDSATTLIERADRNLYLAKNSGRNCVMVSARTEMAPAAA